MIGDAPPDVIFELARQEGCSEAVALEAMRRNDRDPRKARDWIRYGIVCSEHANSATSILDRDLAQAAIDAADAEFATWERPAPLSHATIVFGVVVYEVGEFSVSWQFAPSNPIDDTRRAIKAYRR